MNTRRFGLLLIAVVPCFLILGIAIRYTEVMRAFWYRESPVSIQRMSDTLAVGQRLPMKKELMGNDARMRVLVARSERYVFKYDDPLACMNEECGSAFGLVKKLGGVLDAFTNYKAVANAWGIPLISDRWGTRPAETVTVVTDGNGVVAAIYRHADLDDLDVVLGAAP